MKNKKKSAAIISRLAPKRLVSLVMPKELKQKAMIAVMKEAKTKIVLPMIDLWDSGIDFI